MTSLSTAASIAEILGAVMVIGGVVFAVIQLSQYRLQRQAQATLELARSFENAEFANALRLVLSLQEDAKADDVRGRGAAFESAAMLVSFTMEATAVMVHRRMVSIELVWELMGGVFTDAWHRLEDWTRAEREIRKSEKFNEWSQWLVEQLVRNADLFREQPAYISYRDWNLKGSPRY